MSAGRTQRLLIFIVAYNAERTIARTLTRIPASLLEQYDVEVLVIDDASQDRTFEHGHDVGRLGEFPFRLTVLVNPVNQGYGGNQKIGFQYAIEHQFDFVALVHGDGQYAPECLPQLVQPLADGTTDAVFGSRMLTRYDALKGGMPLYKFVGNKVLTFCQNRLLRASLSEFHSGYRVYSVEALRHIPFQLNSNVFHFDTEIIIQLLIAKQRILETPIPTYYGDEICHVNGIKYGWNVLAASVKARIQEMSLFYDPRFDCQPRSRENEQYLPKLGYDSTHALALERIPAGSKVLDLGCAGGYMAAELRKRGCYVAGVDVFPLAEGVTLDEFYLHDLNDADLPVDLSRFDYVLLLDVIEHLRSPERFVQTLKEAAACAPHLRFVVSTGNVGFFVIRLMLLVGQLNYGKRGILDLTHTRLFTDRAFRRLFEQAGFDVLESHGVCAPFPLAVGNQRLARLLLFANRLLIRVRRTLFSYQVLLVIRPRPSLAYLLSSAEKSSQARAAAQVAARTLTGAHAERP
jgi:glycosyltransferase involved in cell wall biosynthesis/2-polyprenyl-3-methyl-5-hydroxy-6-metoxy-1,4-benzoquinol methylase